MDDLDIGGIEEILKRAARIRADVKGGFNYDDIKPKSVGCYKCNGCGEENSLLSSWCFKCGLPKFGSSIRQKTKPCQYGSDTLTARCNVYNTDQLLQELQPKQVSTPVEKPREINTTKCIAKGEITVFEYNEVKENKPIIGSREIQIQKQENGHRGETVESEAEFLEFPSFSNEDIILYDRCESKKSKKRLYIKPLSTPSLTSTFDAAAIKNAWSSPVSKQTKTSATSLNRNSRPSSATKITPQSRPSLATRKADLPQNRPSSACSKRSLNNSLTPSVFERLYNNESKIKTRSVRSSPHLIAVDKSRNVKTSTVALAAPQLSFHSNVQRKSKILTEEKRIINNKRKNNMNNFSRQICAAPLTVSGIRSSLPAKYPLKLYYRVNEGVRWTNLPAEIWVKIMRYISHSDLIELAVSCSYLYQISADSSIWSNIKVSGKDLLDTDLQCIGERCPKYLTLSGCNGEKLSSSGLRSLFRNCATSLRGLTVTDCKGGELVTSSLLLHMSARCQGLSSLHLSLCNLGDEALTQLANRTARLERLCIPMCSGITDTSFRVLLQKHYRNLTCLDITGCYQISAVAISQVSLCPNISSLYLGNCNQINSATLGTLSSKCNKLLILDVRGCKHVSSDSLIALLTANPHIHTLSLSHVAMVTDAVLDRVAKALLSLHVLDLSGCIKVTSLGIQNLVKHPLEALDLGSTAISFRGCCAIANYLSTTLKQVSFNFCSDVNDECVRKIVQKCKKLERMSIFGCSYIRNFSAFSRLNANLVLDF